MRAKTLGTIVVFKPVFFLNENTIKSRRHGLISIALDQRPFCVLYISSPQIHVEFFFKRLQLPVGANVYERAINIHEKGQSPIKPRAS